MTAAQLEVGSTATPFVQESYATNLVKCMRYYQRHIVPKLRGVVTSATVASRMGMTFPVTMRVAPTASISGTLSVFDGTNISTSTSFSGGFTFMRPESFECELLCSTGLTFGRPALVIDSATGSIVLSAEL